MLFRSKNGNFMISIDTTAWIIETLYTYLSKEFASSLQTFRVIIPKNDHHIALKYFRSKSSILLVIFQIPFTKFSYSVLFSFKV